MKKFLAALGAAVLLVLAGGAALAAGPNGHNDKGLCTAYFNGQKVGHGPGENTDDPPPFQGLQEAGEAYTQEDGRDNDRQNGPDDPNESQNLTDAENIYNFCSHTTEIGGNPEHGRFTCTDPGTGAFGDPASDPECNRNDKPGNG